jgi:hypothetical protein
MEAANACSGLLHGAASRAIHSRHRALPSVELSDHFAQFSGLDSVSWGEAVRAIVVLLEIDRVSTWVSPTMLREEDPVRVV